MHCHTFVTMEYSLFEDSKFNALKYNVFAVKPTKNILDELPALRNLKSFVDAGKERKDINKVIRYIVAMYDSKSPFVKMFQAVDQRRKECASFAGFDLVKDKELLDRMFSFTNPLVNEDEEQEDFTWFSDMVLDFLRDQNQRVWAMIVSNEQTFYEYQKALLSEITVFTTEKDKLNAISIKTKLMEDSDAISARLEKYYQVLYGDEIVNSTTINYTPEALARKANV